jgi:hypothetical protein
VTGCTLVDSSAMPYVRRLQTVVPTARQTAQLDDSDLRIFCSFPDVHSPSSGRACMYVCISACPAPAGLRRCRRHIHHGHGLPASQLPRCLFWRLRVWSGSLIGMFSLHPTWHHPHHPLPLDTDAATFRLADHYCSQTRTIIGMQ